MVTDVNHIYGGDHFATYINIKKKMEVIVSPELRAKFQVLNISHVPCFSYFALKEESFWVSVRKTFKKCTVW